MIDILFIDGLEPRFEKSYCSFLGYLFSLGSVLEQNNYNFKIFNITFLDNYSLDGIIEELYKINFKSVGMTTTADNYAYVKEITNRIKKDFPDIPIILGGPQVTYNEDFIFKECSCDVIVRHEGDYKLILLLDYFIKHIGNIKSIGGISYRSDDGIIKTRDVSFINLDDLPIPQYAILKDTKYWHLPQGKTERELIEFLDAIKHINNTIITSRGCPYNCIFCVEGSLTRSYRERSLDLVIKDIEYFLQITNLTIILIADSTFTSSPKRVKEFCLKIKKLREKYNFVWFAEGRANILAKNIELIDIMHDAGLWNLQIGIETGSEKILKILNKKITKKDVKAVAKKVGTYDNLILSGHIILGNPGETMETFKETIEFSKELHVLSNYNLDLKFGYLVPYVGTPIREKPNYFDIEILVDNFENEKILGYNNVLCKPKNLSLAEVENMYADFGSELSSFYRNSIYKLPKKIIDSKMSFFIKLRKGNFYRLTSSFTKAFGSLIAIQKYYLSFDSKTIIKDMEIIENEPEVIYPVRLWELYYNENTDSYSYISLSGQKKELKNEDKYLWEMASGVNTLSDIISINIKYKITINYVLKFYKELYEDYALLFRK